MNTHDGDEPSSGPPAEPTQAEADAAWRAIVENFGDRASLDGPDGPDAPDGREPAPDDPVVSPGLFRLAGAPVDPGTGRPAVGDVGAGGRTTPDDEDHFVPPPPPPVPRTSPERLAAWLGLLLSPTILLFTVLAGIDLPSTLSGLLLLWFLGGFGFLVATMPRRPGGDGWDDGARL